MSKTVKSNLAYLSGNITQLSYRQRHKVLAKSMTSLLVTKITKEALL